MASPPRFKDAIAALLDHGVEMIVVGGVAGVLGGAPITTFDLDIVIERTEDNIERLVGALASLDARYRDFSGRVLRPEAPAFRGPGHHLLLTTAGPVDILGVIVGDRGYAELLAHTRELVWGGRVLRILDLPMLIQLKTELGRDKDLAVLAILRRTLAERSSQ